ncbi:MAG: prepilin-type N-terminal cleavage/methylation domain-containing protein [Candidatus Saccharimonadales bacterium]
MKLSANQRGFTLVEGLLIFIIVAIIGGTAYYVYHTSQQTDKNLKNASNDADFAKKKKEASAKSEKTMALASKSVMFKVPSSWTNDGVGCVADSAAYSNQKYIDSVAILPGEKLPTIYGSGTEFFHINVCVFENPDNMGPKEWLQNSVGAGTGFSGDESSEEKINGYSAYYQKTKPDYEEVSYVLTGKGKIVLVQARTYETDKKMPGVGDFRKFEQHIKSMVNTITIN